MENGGGGSNRATKPWCISHQHPFSVGSYILKHQPKMIILLLVMPLSSICVHHSLILSGFCGSKYYTKLCKLKSCRTFHCKTSVNSIFSVTSLAYWLERVRFSSQSLIPPRQRHPCYRCETHYWKSCKLNNLKGWPLEMAVMLEHTWHSSFPPRMMTTNSKDRQASPNQMQPDLISTWTEHSVPVWISTLWRAIMVVRFY